MKSIRGFTSMLKALLLLLSCAGGTYAESPNLEVRYFDHYAHGIGAHKTSALCQDGVDNDSDGQVDEDDRGCADGRAQKKALECVSCHGDQGQQRMGHAQCDTCHDVSKILSKNGGPSVPYCRSCHLNNSIFRHPPYKQVASMARFNTREPEGGWSTFTLPRFNHEKHAAWMICEHCHVQLSPEAVMSERQKRTFRREVRRGQRPQRGHFFDAGFKPVNHQACAACHAQKLPNQPRILPQMSNCTGCHQVNSSRVPHQIRTTQTTGYFTHHQHREALDAPLPCESCHQANGIDTKTQAVQLPLMANCSSCHNGTSVFDMKTSNCARCHVASMRP